MRKIWRVILVAVSMVVFGSMAFAGDIQSTPQNSPDSRVMFANNSQASFQMNDIATEKFCVDNEVREQVFLLAADGSDDLDCEKWCGIFNENCPPVSPSAPPDFFCNMICSRCKCAGCP